MAKNMNLIIGSVLGMLNNSNVIAKPNSDYVGSLFFGPNQELSFRYNAPKGRVTPGESFNDEKGFGNCFKRTKHYNLHIDFYTVNGYTDSTGKKDTELINRYLDLIETGFINNVGSYSQLTIEEISDEFEPQRAEEIGNNIWVARKLVVLKERR